MLGGLINKIQTSQSPDSPQLYHKTSIKTFLDLILSNILSLDITAKGLIQIPVAYARQNTSHYKHKTKPK